MKKTILLLLLFLFFLLPLIGEGSSTWTKIEFEIESLQVPARAAAIGEDLDKEYRLGVRSVIEIIENGSAIKEKEISNVNMIQPTRGAGLKKGESVTIVVEKIHGRTYFPRLKAFANGLEYLESIIDDPGDDPSYYMIENAPKVNCQKTGNTYAIPLTGTRIPAGSWRYSTVAARCPREIEVYYSFSRNNWISIGNNYYLTWDFPQF